MNFTTFDTVILTITSISSLLGLYRGCVYISINLICTILSLIGAYFLYPITKMLLGKYVSSQLFLFILACVVSYLISYIISSIISSQMNSLLSKFSGGIFDKFLGFIIGIMRGLGISVLIFTIISAVIIKTTKSRPDVTTSQIDEKKYPAWLEGSISLPYLEKLKIILSSLLSDKFLEKTDIPKILQPDNIMDLLRKKSKDSNEFKEASEELDKNLKDELHDGLHDKK